MSAVLDISNNEEYGHPLEIRFDSNGKSQPIFLRTDDAIYQLATLIASSQSAAGPFKLQYVPSIEWAFSDNSMWNNVNKISDGQPLTVTIAEGGGFLFDEDAKWRNLLFPAIRFVFDSTPIPTDIIWKLYLRKVAGKTRFKYPDQIPY